MGRVGSEVGSLELESTLDDRLEPLGCVLGVAQLEGLLGDLHGLAVVAAEFQRVGQGAEAVDLDQEGQGYSRDAKRCVSSLSEIASTSFFIGKLVSPAYTTNLCVG